MSIPRYVESGEKVDYFLTCACGWAITKDSITSSWTECRKCGGKLKTTRVSYGPAKPVLRRG